MVVWLREVMVPCHIFPEALSNPRVHIRHCGMNCDVKHRTYLHRRQKPLRQCRTDDHIQLACRTTEPSSYPSATYATKAHTHTHTDTELTETDVRPNFNSPRGMLTRVHQHAVFRVVHERRQLRLQADHEVAQ